MAFLAWFSRLLVLLLLTATGAGQALAHAALVSTSPKDGAIVAGQPSELTLAFTEPVSPITLKLIGPDGSASILERSALRDKTLVVTPPAGLRDGTHVLSWRVISEDGHPVSGSVLFSIGAPTATPLANEKTDVSVVTAIWFAKVALYLGLFFGVGALAYNARVSPLPPAAERIAGWLMVVGLLAAISSLGLQGLDVLGVPLGEIGKFAPWAAGLHTSFGLTAIIAAATFIVGLASLRVRQKGLGSVLASLALIGVGAALAASGHASAASPQWLTRSAVFVHATAIAFWAGALIPLAEVLSRRGPGSVDALRRFSRAIPFFVALLVIAGSLLAIIQVETPTALWTTSYGRVLLIKLAMLAGLFGLAIVNRYRFTPPAEAGDFKAMRLLTRSIKIEVVLVLAIFAVAAVWRFTVPPRALAAAKAAPAHIHIHSEKAMVDVSIMPGRAGPVTASIDTMTGEGDVLKAKEIRLMVANPAAGIEPIERQAFQQPDGTWLITDLTLPMAGRWKIDVEILIDDFESVRVSGMAEVRQ
ncbi:copper resistance CopC/CopD family protein [Bradyrhizobium sp. GCM10027634]|uniref:copper resistance CopC/CopD family protein n=1 Tax=unclassified Bradyrhizobium TaxID=2631580 RepID=UPI00188A63A7|nr:MULTISPECIES: copper resistance protein CopC [unclassified Bradyrhizobium]MDN5004047.1 copper resistance protein CopC [Bradyrhizobium sp. WYCCWR 12677]QOZ44948.1 copper resistance protein CopC [Bradyrhizobium sp. CCBAU 53340]